jgi:hypothetical protein
MLGKLATPFVHPITRHDMRVSIEAGFRHGELPAALGVSHRVRESVSWRGSLRIFAQRTNQSA